MRVRQTVVRLLRRIATLVETPTLGEAKARGLNMQFVQKLIGLREVLHVRPRTIMDVGAAVGEFSMAARFVFPSAYIHAFEPVEPSQIAFRTLFTGDQRFSLHGFALGKEDATTNFHLNDFSFSSSLLKMTQKHKQLFPQTKNEGIISVDVRRLDSISLGLLKPVLLKMDVQGSELDVLAGGRSTLDLVDIVWLEVSFEELYERQANFDEVIVFMKNSGFKRFHQIDFEIVSDPEPQIAYCDLVFFR
jgi:FkbM family methyltransferase